jgi:hypothetical protein
MNRLQWFVSCVFGQLVLVCVYAFLMVLGAAACCVKTVLVFFKTSYEMWTYQPKPEDQPWT